jgi:hypothetical protein
MSAVEVEKLKSAVRARASSARPGSAANAQSVLTRDATRDAPDHIK